MDGAREVQDGGGATTETSVSIPLFVADGSNRSRAANEAAPAPSWMRLRLRIER